MTAVHDTGVGIDEVEDPHVLEVAAGNIADVAREGEERSTDEAGVGTATANVGEWVVSLITRLAVSPSFGPALLLLPTALQLPVVAAEDDVHDHGTAAYSGTSWAPVLRRWTAGKTTQVDEVDPFPEERHGGVGGGLGLLFLR